MVGGLTAADYDALPEDVCRQIEVVDGAIIVCPSPSRSHQRVARHLANVLENACGQEQTVATDVDLRWHTDDSSGYRRPDIVVYDSSLSNDAQLAPEHCLLVIEVMSPSTVTIDRVHKPAEYAMAGIEHFWRIEPNDRLTVFRYRLDPMTRTYASAGVSTGKLVVTDPFTVSVDLDDLL
jgi:Uma2 family endonuclease